jgi:hypothetical protein
MQINIYYFYLIANTIPWVTYVEMEELESS